jgi:hypothetical protein
MNTTCSWLTVRYCLLCTFFGFIAASYCVLPSCHLALTPISPYLQVRAGGRIPLIIGKSLTAKARQSLGKCPAVQRGCVLFVMVYFLVRDSTGIAAILHRSGRKMHLNPSCALMIFSVLAVVSWVEFVSEGVSDIYPVVSQAWSPPRCSAPSSAVPPPSPPAATPWPRRSWAAPAVCLRARYDALLCCWGAGALSVQSYPP